MACYTSSACSTSVSKTDLLADSFYDSSRLRLRGRLHQAVSSYSLIKMEIHPIFDFRGHTVLSLADGVLGCGTTAHLSTNQEKRIKEPIAELRQGGGGEGGGGGGRGGGGGGRRYGA